MTEQLGPVSDPWSSSSSDSPERAESRLDEVRQHVKSQSRVVYAPLFTVMIILVVIGDQLSKAWFVYRLGNHQSTSFGDFLSQYYRLFAGFGAGGQMIVSHYLPFKDPIPVAGDWVRWLLTTNTGAAWSLFAGNSLALSAVSIVIATGLYFLWQKSFRHSFSMSLACGAIIGGALGNFIDRFRLHEVVDFISVRIPLIGKLIPALGDPYDFPIFNVADACAVCGTLGLAIYLVNLDIAASRRARAKRAERRAQIEQLKADKERAGRESQPVSLSSTIAKDEAREQEDREQKAEQHRSASLHEATGALGLSTSPVLEGRETEGGEHSAEAAALGVAATDAGVLEVESPSDVVL